MANRDNHYEAAFEAYLRDRRVPYVAVDEARRARSGDTSLKSLDFIVSPPDRQSWLVDVKGRRFPGGGRSPQYWKNWSTRDDLRCLGRWEHLFGPRFTSLFVFVYLVVGDRAPLPAEQLFEHHEKLYGMVGIRWTDYSEHARELSARWDTIAMPVAQFRQLARPVEELFGVCDQQPRLSSSG